MWPKCLQDLQEGSQENGDCGNDPKVIPVWMDMEKFKRGQKFFLDNTMSVLLALYCSLTTGLSISNLLDPLVYTKMSDTPEKALRRYVHTFLHVALWHIGDVWNPEDRAYRSVQNVRRMHGHVARRMLEIRTSDRLYVSQYDMAVVQCGFMGAIIMYPAKFGVKCSTPVLEDYIFFWRGIGYLLGIDDRYNMCSGNYIETYALCKEIEIKLLVPSLQNPPLEFAKMADAYIEGTNIRRRIMCFSKEAIIGFCLDVMGYATQSLGWRDTIRFWWLKLLTFLIMWCPGFAKFNNYLILKNVLAFVHVIDK